MKGKKNLAEEINLLNPLLINISYAKNILLYLTLVVVILSNSSSSKTKGISRSLLLIQSYEITLKIRTGGNQTIISQSYNHCPDIIYVDGEETTPVDSPKCRTINLKKVSSTIKLVWNSTSNNLDYMFKDLVNLLEVDLSKYDTSSVTSMKQLFYGCNSLISVNLSGLNTSSVTNISEIFSNCTSLTEIDLSSFDTSEVTLMMNCFFGCKSLISLNLSSFNTSKVKQMDRMFQECVSLTSLDLSNFDTSQVTDMNYMFGTCLSLISLDLSNFETHNLKISKYMFNECKSLKELNISKMTISEVTNAKYMFGYCTSLTSIDVSNFNTSNVINMDLMFNACYSLVSLNVNHFNTMNVQNINSMFKNCYSLTSLNISNFITDKVTNMEYMFYNCSKLKVLELNNFNTSKVQKMNFMFYNCGIESLDLSHFNTKSVNNIKYMFQKCESLISLDISNFNTTSVTTMEGMFSGCKNIKYINFKNFSKSSKTNIDNIFNGININVVLCFNNKNYLQAKIDSIKCHTLYCGDDWHNHIKKIVESNKSCVDNCSNFIYENNDICYDTAPPMTELIQDYTTYFPTEMPTITTQVSIINNSSNDIDTNNFTEIAVHSTQLESNSLTIDFKTDHIDELTDFKLDTTNDISESNYIMVETTNILNSSLVLTIEEKNQLKFEEIGESILPSFSGNNGEEVIIEGDDDFYFCLSAYDGKKFPEKSNNNSNRFSVIDLGECEDRLREKYGINDSLSFIILKYEKISNDSVEKTIQYEVYEPINKTKLDLSICSDISIDIYVPVELSPKLQNLYNELKDFGYDLFDINDDFYQDICTPYNSENGTDVLLSDRINYYYNNDETRCQANCKLSNYLPEEQYIKCECDISNSEIKTESTNKFSAKFIYESFFDILKYSNYKVLKCFNLVFKLNNLTKNKGSILTLVYFAVFLVIIILFYIKGFNQLKEFISFDKNIKNTSSKNLKIYEKEKPSNNDNKIKPELKQNEIMILNNITNKNNDSKITKRSSKDINNNQIHRKNNSKNLSLKRYKRRKSSIKSIIFQNPPKKDKIKRHANVDNNFKKINNDIKIVSDERILTNKCNFNEYENEKYSNSNKIINQLSNDNNINLEINQYNKEAPLDNFELNNLEYEEAIKLDKRKFLELYWSILKREHLILFTFFNWNDHNIIFLKFIRFIFLVCTDMAMNVFFFSDDTMHKMFLDYGKYNFIQQIPQIVYSTIISNLIEIILCYLSLTDKLFYQMKKFNEKDTFTKAKIIKCIKLKINFFFVFTFIMFLFYWYLITSFCAVYQNTQIAFIKDSLVSFCLGLLYPFVLYLIPSSLRIISLKFTRWKLSFIYKLSDIIPIF